MISFSLMVVIWGLLMLCGVFSFIYGFDSDKILWIVLGVILAILPAICLIGIGIGTGDDDNLKFEIEHEFTLELLPFENGAFVIGSGGNEIKGVKQYEVSTRSKNMILEPDKCSLNYVDSDYRLEIYNVIEYSKILFLNVLGKEYKYYKIFIPEGGYIKT